MLQFLEKYTIFGKIYQNWPDKMLKNLGKCYIFRQKGCKNVREFAKM